MKQGEETFSDDNSVNVATNVLFYFRTLNAISCEYFVIYCVGDCLKYLLYLVDFLLECDFFVFPNKERFIDL